MTTTNTTSAAQSLFLALKAIGEKPRSYSGRGMFGKCCVGVPVQRGQRGTLLLGLGFEAARINSAASAAADAPLDVARLGESLRSDALGLGEILYWPSMAWDPATMSESHD